MKIIEIKCPSCGAAIKTNIDNPMTTCEFCGKDLFFDDETTHIKLDDMTKSGYEFEKGRILAQKEEEERLEYEALQEKLRLRELGKKRDEEKRKEIEEINRRRQEEADFQRKKERKRFKYALLMSAVDLGLIVFSMMNHFSLWYALIPLLLAIGTQLFSTRDRVWSNITLFLLGVALVCAAVEISKVREPFLLQMIRAIVILVMFWVNCRWNKQLKEQRK